MTRCDIRTGNTALLRRMLPLVMLRQLMEFIFPSKRALRTCEACDQPFVCGASIAGCWCLRAKVAADVRQQLRGKYKQCLCRACLERFANVPSGDSPNDT